MTDFTNYTDANLSAIKRSAKATEIITRKQSILDGVYAFYNFAPSTILFVGFNPAILSPTTQEVFVTEISPAVQVYLDRLKVKCTYLTTAALVGKQFDVVIAADEYFTYAKDAQDQIDKVMSICSLAKEFVISTLRDYKNQEFRDKEFSIPAVVRNQASTTTYTEFHDWSLLNRTQWNSKVCEIDNVTNALTVFGPFKRHTMYFKQLAKFSMDAGADNFIVHKNLMYKSPIKRNYEHVISIKFEK